MKGEGDAVWTSNAQRHSQELLQGLISVGPTVLKSFGVGKIEPVAKIDGTDFPPKGCEMSLEDLRTKAIDLRKTADHLRRSL